jgi:histidine phosphotransfer protein HptB
MSAAHEPSRPAMLISQLLLEDADLRDVVEEFVTGLHSRLEELRQAHERLDWDMLTMVAHRLKGAAGSYGYPEISQVCATMEHQFSRHHADDFGQFLRELQILTAAARAGLEQPKG